MIKIITPLDQIDTSAKFTLGTRTGDKFGNEYIYLRGVSTGTIYKVVSYDEFHYTTLAINSTALSMMGPLASLMATIDSTSKYGWAQLKGTGTTLCVGSITVDTRIGPSATAGMTDDFSTGTYNTVGMWARLAGDNIGQHVTTQFNYPSVIDTTI